MDAIFYRVMCEAYYVVTNKCTVREAAKVLGVSKSNLHVDITTRLEKYDANLAKEVRKVLDTNKDERYSRGNSALREKQKLEKLKKEQQ